MPKSEAYARFLKSMDQDVEDLIRWSRYDLDAIDELSPDEKSEIETLLISTETKMTWDVEALIRLGTPAAIAALDEVTRTGRRWVRLQAAEYLHSIGQYPDISQLIYDALTANADPATGYACRLAHRFPSAKIEEALVISAWKYPTETRSWECLNVLLKIRRKTNETPHCLSSLQREPSPNRHARCRSEVERVCRRIGVDWTVAMSEDERRSRNLHRQFLAFTLVLIAVALILKVVVFQ